jgi:DNA-binding CsgD family transcriptional regulator
VEPVGIERQFLVGLPSHRYQVRGICLYRHRRDFSNRDRLLLTLLHPHILQAGRNANWVTQTLDDLRMLERGIERLEQGLIALSSEATVRLATKQARKWLRAYFPGPPPGAGRLPDPLRRWVLQEIRRPDESAMVPSPHHTLTVEGTRARLVVRLVADREGPLIVLHEQRPGATSRYLGSLGLSPRETEVLTWVTVGKTNPEIAVILGLSPRTVQTHLERIFEKLGVENRTAAAALALGAPGPS